MPHFPFAPGAYLLIVLRMSKTMLQHFPACREYTDCHGIVIRENGTFRIGIGFIRNDWF